MTGIDQALGNILQMYEQSPGLLLATILIIAAVVVIIKYMDKIGKLQGQVDEAEPRDVARDYFKEELETEGEKQGIPLFKRTDTGLNRLGTVKYSCEDEVRDYGLSPLPLIKSDPHKEESMMQKEEEKETEDVSFEKVKMLQVDNENTNFLDKLIDKLKRKDSSVYYSMKPEHFEDDAVDKMIIKKSIVLDSTYGIKHDRSTVSENIINKGIRKGFAEELTKNQFNLPRYVNHGNQKHSMQNENIEVRSNKKEKEDDGI